MGQGHRPHGVRIGDTVQREFHTRIEGSIYCFGNHLLAKVLRLWIGAGGKGSFNIHREGGKGCRLQCTGTYGVWRKSSARAASVYWWHATSLGRLGLVIVY